MHFQIDPYELKPTWYPLFDFIAQSSLYLLVATSTYFFLFKNPRFQKKRFDQKPLPSKQVASEIKHSLLTLVFFAITGALTYGLSFRWHFLKFYGDAEQHGLLYFFASPFLYVIFHDAYFYWTHRFLHTKKMFRIGHELHHRSYNPTPYTVYSFNLIESFLDSMYVPIIALVLPIHPYALLTFLLMTLFFNFVGHLGHELYPRAFFRSWVSEVFMTSTYHQLHHHGGPRTNFGFYFRFWDRACGTEDPRYAIAIKKYAESPLTVAAEPVLGSRNISSEHSSQLTG